MTNRMYLTSFFLVVALVNAFDSSVHNVVLPQQEVHANSNNQDSSSQDDVRSSTWKYRVNDDGVRCFTTRPQLEHAVDLYMLETTLHPSERSGALKVVVEMFGPMERWCTSLVSDFSNLFSSKRNPLMSQFAVDISEWDVSEATTMTAMFRGAKAFNASLSGWDVSNVVTMDSMFRDASLFGGDLSRWNVSNVQKMNLMFKNAPQFDSDLGQWDVRQVANICYMFSGAKTFSHNLCAWGELLPIASKSGVFRGAANCPSQEDPDLVIVPSGPFCHVCQIPEELLADDITEADILEE